jgi:hypothetical protein
MSDGVCRRFDLSSIGIWNYIEIATPQSLTKPILRCPIAGHIHELLVPTMSNTRWSNEVQKGHLARSSLRMRWCNYM